MSKNRGVRKNQRARVFAKTNHLCWYCGEYADTGDHFVPIRLTRDRKRMLPYEIKSRRNILNIIPACYSCNKQRAGCCSKSSDSTNTSSATMARRCSHYPRRIQMELFKPLLAWKPAKDQVLEEELAKLTVWPRLVSRKLDGIRATVQAGRLVSRTLKDIPNVAIQDMFKGLPDGLDGELIYGAPNAPDVFNKTSSIVMGNKPMHQQMAREGVKYYLFD